MENREKVTLAGIWRGIYPVFLYELIQGLAAVLYAAYLLLSNLQAENTWREFEASFARDYLEGTVPIILAGAFLALPVFVWLYCRDAEKKRTGWQENDPAPAEGQLVWVLIGSAALALFANNILSLTPLTYWSDSYEQTNEALYTGSIWLRMVCVGFFAPAVEEFMMRGLFYQRFRRMMGPEAAMLWSSLTFGMIHGNIVQGVYAFLVGLFFAWLMERFQKIIVPVLAHMSANLFVVFLEDSSQLSEVFYGTVPRFFAGTVVSGVLFLIAYWILKYQEN